MQHHPCKPLNMRSLPKDLRPLGRAALAAGWRITVSRGMSHSHWLSPWGRHTLVVSNSPGDPQNGAIIRRQLRRAGVRL
jgi:hypothetical protein